MKKYLLLLCIALFAATGMTFAQNANEKQVTGKLLDAQSKDALIGAAITVKGSARSTTAGLDGSFKIRIPASSSNILVFTDIWPD